MSIVLYEFINPKTARTEELQCVGHIGKDEFSEACLKFLKIAPLDIKYSYRVFKEIVKRELNTGKFLSSYMGHKRCNKDVSGAEPITIGYFI